MELRNLAANVCVWAKNQFVEIFEKVLKFTYKNLNGKLIFYPFSLQSSGTFVILYTSGISKNWGGGRGDRADPGLGGALWSLGAVVGGAV